MSSVRNDIQQTLRQIASAPVFFSVVLLTLGIGIGANTALFSIVKTVLLDPLPYPESEELVMLEQYPWTNTEIIMGLRESPRSFDEVAGLYPEEVAATVGDRPVELIGARTTPNLFRVFQVDAALGRSFVEADARPGAPRTVILSHSVWQAHYGGSSDAINDTLRINGSPHEIIGVLPRGFRHLSPGTEDPEIWMPYELEPTRPDGSLAWGMLLARLKDGVSLEEAQAELDVVRSRFVEKYPAAADNPMYDLRLATVKSVLIRDFETALLVLQLAVGAVLLIACVNVANLLLARFSSRQQELSIRTAVGASRGRIVRQLLTESLVLSVLGGVVGLALMMLSLRLVLAFAPENIPRIGQVSSDFTVFLFTLGISVVAGILFGVIPATVTSRRNLTDFLKEGGRSAAGSTRHHRVSQALVVSEVTLTLVLLVGAGLLVRTFVSLSAQETGFRTEDVITMPIHVPDNRYQTGPELAGYYHRILERVQAVPGVEHVALTNNLPIERAGAIRDYETATGERPRGEADAPTAQYGVVSPDYFRALDIPLLRGRFFDDTDRGGSQKTAIIDEAMWTEAWPRQNPIGRRFRFMEDEDQWLTVVGVVGDIRGEGLANDPGPGFYIPYRQRPETRAELAVGHNVVLLVTPEGEGRELASSLREAIWDVDPNQPVPQITTLAEVVSQGVSPERFRAVLLGTFAAIGLLLVIAGIYGVIEYLVAERTHEFGIRMAMGAARGDIAKGVLFWGLRLTVLGVLLGLIAVFVVNRYLASLLFGVTPTDPLTLTSAVVAVLLVTVTACLVPTRKATRVDPVIALAGELRPDKRTGGGAAAASATSG